MKFLMKVWTLFHQQPDTEKKGLIKRELKRKSDPAEIKKRMDASFELIYELLYDIKEEIRLDDEIMSKMHESLVAIRCELAATREMVVARRQKQLTSCENSPQMKLSTLEP
jgi:hypothetical protein